MLTTAKSPQAVRLTARQQRQRAEAPGTSLHDSSPRSTRIRSYVSFLGALITIVLVMILLPITLLWL